MFLLDSAHVFTLGTTFEPFGTSTKINSTYLLEYMVKIEMRSLSDYHLIAKMGYIIYAVRRTWFTG